MKRFLFIFQILILTIFISSGSGKIEAITLNLPSLPAQDQAYYDQLKQNGDFYTDQHVWLRNGENHIQVGISYSMVAAIGNTVSVITPMFSVDDVFIKGDLLIEITGLFNKKIKIYAPCGGIIKGINPVIESPESMLPNQVWVYKCELKRGQLPALMNEDAYANFIK